MPSKEYMRDWHARHPEKAAEYRQESRKKRGVDYWNDAVRKWRESNPEIASVRSRFYRSQRRALTKGKIVVEDIPNWKSRICGICLAPIEGPYHLDHIVPLSKGGSHTTGNLQLAHPYCNQSKFNHLPDMVL